MKLMEQRTSRAPYSGRSRPGKAPQTQ